MASVGTGQMSVVETGQMSAAKTGQMSAVQESFGFALGVQCSQSAPAWFDERVGVRGGGI